MTILQMCCRSLTFSSPSSAAAAAADDNDDDCVEANIPPRREKYDVFINFRGEDTRDGITSHLHAALLQKKIETYIDNRLQKGEEIGPALQEAIEKSTLSVIIFSQNYASSTWCLDELVHILECKKIYGHMVIPVFYDINPSDVRKQHGSYAGAFAQLEKRFKDNIDKVHKWRDALKTAADLSGFDYSNKRGLATMQLRGEILVLARLHGHTLLQVEKFVM
ncbi:toll/interleukin-1 receptor-like protein [Malus domestica]|uniref:toll/interleukin-1 receptor-like protein n=1 Tax=Malus domestica TaxID=3750 RepID=UPI000498CE64